LPDSYINRQFFNHLQAKLNAAFFIRYVQENIYKPEKNRLGLSYLDNCFKEHVKQGLGLSQAHLQQQGTNYTHTVFSNISRFDDFLLCLL
jgi:hypothetical protein